MKKLTILILGLITLAGCTKNVPLAVNQNQIDPNLK